jgi:nitroreductase
MSIKKQMKKIKFSIVTLVIYLNDYKKYIKATGFGNLVSKDGMIYKLRKDYHKIEKGLTMLPRRDFFGLKVLDNILLHIEQLNDNSNPEVIRAVKVIEKYLNDHKYDKSLNKYIMFIEEFEISGNEDSIGYYEKNNKEFKLSLDEKEQFEKIISERRTVRHFKNDFIDNSLFNSVFNIAKFTPSACNRQSWGAKVVKNDTLVKQILSLQNGNNGFGGDVKNIIIITADLNSCFSPEERKQVWFDSGLFTMNLINTLHVNNIGSCCLNWCVGIDKEKEIQRLLQLSSNKVVTVILAVGYYKSSFLVCDSPKKDASEFVEFFL